MKRTIVALVVLAGISFPVLASADEAPPAFEKWTYGTPKCAGELYPFTLPEDDENYTYYVDDLGDDSRTLRFYVEDTETGKELYSEKHTFPNPCKDDDVDKPKPTLPNTGA